MTQSFIVHKVNDSRDALYRIGMIVALAVGLLVFRNAQGAELTSKNRDCRVCGKELRSGKAYRFPAGLVCVECHDLDTRCIHCGLPAKTGFVKTTDGRVICSREKKDAVMEQAQAQAIFKQVRAELWQRLGSAIQLRQSKVSVRLFDVDYWNYRDGKPVPPELRRSGFSQSTKIGDRLNHNVLLLNGMLSDQVSRVCAHEYMHLWINENRPETRRIEGNSVEAVCELVAYQLMGYRKRSDQQDLIRHNRYTAGKILEVIELEKEFGLKAILLWVTQGKEMQLNRDNLAQFRAASPGPNLAFTSAPRRTPAQRPSQLELKGIIGTGPRRVVLINDRTFGLHDTDEVRVGDQRLKIRCLDILPDAVVVNINGAKTNTTLRLNPPTGK